MENWSQQPRDYEEMVYVVNFPALPAQEKKNFVNGLVRAVHQSFSHEPVQKSWLAQLLIMTRCRNSYCQMEMGIPEPELITRALDQLWRVLAGEITMETFQPFQDGFSSSLLYFMTGDDSELEENKAYQPFYDLYFNDWNHFYTILADGLCTLGDEICSQTVNWRALEELIDGDICGDIIDQYEDVYQNPTGGYKIAELDLRNSQIYESATFEKVIACFQQDMKAAVSDGIASFGSSITALRIKYAAERLF